MYLCSSSGKNDNIMDRIITYLLEEKQAKRKGGLYHKTQVSLTYNSNRIEGSRLTEEQTRYIFESRTIGFKDEEAVPVDDIIETSGRVGRLIMFRECLRHDIIPFIIDERHKQFYYRGLKEFATTPGYLLDTRLSAQDTYTAWVEYFYKQ